ncbi:MAG: hypothetical protein QOI63_1845 [Thermoplasmata archaeon]|jgi:hypothetical protein|nr:hypothetical protein [Thermoplasmata archaeon]
MKDRPQDFSRVVKRHWKDARAYLLASRQPCLKIRDDEVAKIGKNRILVPVQPGDLDGLDPEATWILGVILCPGDPVTDVVRWAKARKIDPRRVWFFLHASTDMAVLQPWADAGHATDQVDFAADWEELHQVFGLYLSDHIYAAHGPPHEQTWTPGRRK